MISHVFKMYHRTEIRSGIPPLNSGAISSFHNGFRFFFSTIHYTLFTVVALIGNRGLLSWHYYLFSCAHQLYAGRPHEKNPYNAYRRQIGEFDPCFVVFSVFRIFFRRSVCWLHFNWISTQRSWNRRISKQYWFVWGQICR